MVGFFAERVRGLWVAILAIVSLGYGWLILPPLVSGASDLVENASLTAALRSA